MICERCQKRGKTWKGSDPTCAFLEGKFISENWNCATMNALREIAEEYSNAAICDPPGYRYRHCDVSLAAIPYSSNSCEKFLVLSWYKDRGRTGQAWIFCDDDAPEVLTLAEAEACLRDYKQ